VPAEPVPSAFPDGWPVVALSSVANVSAGVTLGRRLPAVGSVELPNLRVANVQDGFLDQDDVYTVRVRRSEVERYRLRAGDVLMGEGNANPNNLGRGTIWRDELDECLHQNIVLRVRTDQAALMPEFLLAVSASAHGRRYFRVNARQTSIAHLGLSALAAFPVPLPSISTQRSFVATVDDLDGALAACRRSLAKLERIRAGALQAALHGHDFMDTPYGRVPADWPLVPLGDMAEVVAGVTLGRALPALGSVERPYLRVANVQDGYFDLTDVKTVRVRLAEVERYRLRAGDVLMNEGGDFDKLGRGSVWRGEIGDCLHQNIVLRARVDQKRVLPEFVSCVASSDYGRTYFRIASKQSTNIAHLGLSQLKAWPVPVPPLRDQDRIVRTLAVHDERIEAERTRVEKLGRIRIGVIEDLLAGAPAG
jgi:type I restriction enzyme S subunit